MSGDKTELGNVSLARERFIRNGPHREYSQGGSTITISAGTKWTHCDLDILKGVMFEEEEVEISGAQFKMVHW